MKKFMGGIAILMLMGGILLPGVRPAAPPNDGAVPDYRVTWFFPQGFSHSAGIYDMVPVSKSSGVAFAGNMTSTGFVNSLLTYQLTGSGVTTRGRMFGSGMGEIRKIAALWITSSGSGYGLVYALFETAHSNPEWSALSLRIAKFNASGQRTSGWKEIWNLSTPQNTYVVDARLNATNRGDLIGVVFSVWVAYAEPWRNQKSLVYFFEANIKNGQPTHSLISTPVYGDGSLVGCSVYRPAWNGSYWLVPVSDYVYLSPGGEDDIYLGETSILAIGSDTSQPVVLLTQIKYSKDTSMTFGDLALAPYPGSTTDQWLFIKTAKAISQAQRKLDKYQFGFSLVRLNSEGHTVQTKTLAISTLAHRLAYDPAYEIYYEYDSFSPIVASAASGTPQLFLSRIHTTNLVKKDDYMADHPSEQQFSLYDINARTGGVALKNKYVTKGSIGVQYGRRPIIFVFPGGPLAVVNNLIVDTFPFDAWSGISTFPHLAD